MAEGHATPTTWSVEKSENIKWKTPIPGLGHSSPVIWGNRIYLTTAIDEKKESSLKVGLYGAIEPVNDDSAQAWKVLCIDKKSGRILWERSPNSGIAKTKRHPKSTHANPTPATDGKYVVAFFGSEGLYVYNVEGKLLWKKDLGVMDAGFFRVPEAQWGFSSSPVIFNDMVIVQCDVLTKPFLAAFRLKDGSPVWRTEREMSLCSAPQPFLEAVITRR